MTTTLESIVAGLAEGNKQAAAAHRTQTYVLIAASACGCVLLFVIAIIIAYSGWANDKNQQLRHEAELAQFRSLCQVQLQQNSVNIERGRSIDDMVTEHLANKKAAQHGLRLPESAQ